MTETITLLKSEFSRLGGAENYARTLANAFHKKGCNLRLLTSGPYPDDLPFEVLSTTLSAKTSLGKWNQFYSFCKREIATNPTSITFGLDRSPYQTHLRAGSGVHRAFLEHRKMTEGSLKSFRHKINPLHRMLLDTEKKAIEHPELRRLFTNSHLVKREILSYYDIDQKKISVIHNGVQWHEDEESFNNWENHYNSRNYDFLFIGHNFARKGLATFLKGLALLPTKEWTLTIIGNDKKKKSFISLAKRLGLEQQVRFCGPKKNLTPFFQAADCLVIPSYYDPFANVTIEALSMGLFVISSKNNGGSEVLCPNTGHIIEDLHAIESMKEALEIALSRPKTPNQAKKIRSSVRHLDLSNQLEKYIEQTLC
ncbi:MAG: Lipopolysaccharide core biosynthesis protein RfaG [Chlamydiae bacterium]|nr:Lipopolysaccharide core biosynthesis protein RfaG [Chlamydiota bacterium]